MESDHPEITAEDIKEALNPLALNSENSSPDFASINNTDSSSSNEEEVPLIGNANDRKKKFSDNVSNFLSKNFYGKFLLITLKEIPKNKVGFILGFMSCFVVVLVVSLMTTIFNYSPVVFLKLAEAEVGEIDFTITPGDWSNREFINYTLMSEVISNKKVNDFTFHSPRYENDISVIAAKDCDPNVDPFSLTWKYLGEEGNNTCIYDEDNCLPQYCPNAKSRGSVLILFNSQREERMVLGREWISKKHPKVSVGEVHVTKSLANSFNVEVGSILYLKINGSRFFTTLWKKTVNYTTTVVEEDLDIDQFEKMSQINREFVYVPVTVKNIFDGYQGKFSGYYKNVIMMDYEAFLPYFVQQLHPLLPVQAKAALQAVDLLHHSQFVMFNLPDPRYKPYINSDFDAIQRSLTEFSSNILFTILLYI